MDPRGPCLLWVSEVVPTGRAGPDPAGNTAVCVADGGSDKDFRSAAGAEEKRLGRTRRIDSRVLR